MHTSLLIAGLVAITASATPLKAARSASVVTPSAFVTSIKPTTTSLPPSFQNSTANAATSLLGVPTASPNPAAPTGFVSKLLTEDTTVNRFKDIEAALNDSSISLVFDFNPAANPKVKPGQGGQVDLANRANFPILTGTGISSAGVFFQPCGLNTPHIHPRATEFFTLVTDTKMETGFVLENGLTTEFKSNLTQYQGTVFPQGSIHWQQNLDCKSAVGIAGLNSEDPGASSIANNFLVNTSEDVVDAAIGFPKEISADNFGKFKANIPPSIARGVEECLIRCGIQY